MFFVADKNPSKVRVVIDARSSNIFFKKPPWCPLGSVDTLCRVRVGKGRSVFTAHEDIKDSFYRPGILTASSANTSVCFRVSNALLIDAFCSVGVAVPDELDFRDPSNEVEPCLSVLRMGVRWAFLHSQQVRLHISRQGPPHLPDSFV